MRNDARFYFCLFWLQTAALWLHVWLWHWH